MGFQEEEVGDSQKGRCQELVLFFLGSRHLFLQPPRGIPQGISKFVLRSGLLAKAYGITFWPPTSCKRRNSKANALQILCSATCNDNARQPSANGTFVYSSGLLCKCAKAWCYCGNSCWNLREALCGPEHCYLIWKY